METAQIDASLERLQAAKSRWATMPIEEKISHLESIRDETGKVARPWVEAAVKAKGLSMDSPLAGEEWTSGPFAVIALVNDLIVSLERLEAEVPILEGYPVRTAANGQVVVEVFPNSAEDRLLFSGVSAEVWMDPDVTVESLPETVAAHYRDDDPAGGVELVLAAGNIASIAPNDVISSMFGSGKVVVLKMNPVNDYLGEYMEMIFSSLAAEGFIAFAYGGVDVGAYLTGHELVDSIHITGSGATHDAIVYGPGEEGAANKAQDAPINTKPIGSELGGASPVIVVPGPWSARDIRFQAEQIVSQKVHNSGFNCVAAQVVIVPEGWEHTATLLDEVRRVLAEVDDRPAYYPGAMDRCDAVVDRSSGVEVYGDGEPRYLVTGLDWRDEDELLFTTEVFGPVLGVVPMPAPDVPSYLIKAVAFANERLYGTLGANILIHPRTARKYPKQLERAVAELAYGTVAVNLWTGGAYFMSKCTWGAFPGHTSQDIQSGRGVVHNVLMFDRAQKSVVYGPFAPGQRAWLKGEFHAAPKPIYFVTNSQAHNIGERLIPYSVAKRPVDLAKVASSAMRG